MPTLRTKPMGHSISDTVGKAYLYSRTKAAILRIPTVASTNPLIVDILASNIELAHIPSRIKKLPYLAMEEKFTSAGVTINDCVVAVGNCHFLFSAHYSPAAPINGALKELTPGFDWRGEIIIVALGKVKPYISRMKASQVSHALNSTMIWLGFGSFALLSLIYSADLHVYRVEVDSEEFPVVLATGSLLIWTVSASNSNTIGSARRWIWGDHPYCLA
ncbi:hypothetical protein DFH08DRAFT_820081 [Mycena albidolilacea]|uniref:Uncharacterized protein n=1 Tax=Mycena albidolilacea TaxID=1033008 RepID=A0AAD7EEE9_9AGAR|nr:hypothetical protein DFH08DRAFT_820081 [Mycena albidolilacea]